MAIRWLEILGSRLSTALGGGIVLTATSHGHIFDTLLTCVHGSPVCNGAAPHVCDEGGLWGMGWWCGGGVCVRDVGSRLSNTFGAVDACLRSCCIPPALRQRPNRACEPTSITVRLLHTVGGQHTLQRSVQRQRLFDASLLAWPRIVSHAKLVDPCGATLGGSCRGDALLAASVGEEAVPLGVAAGGVGAGTAAAVVVVGRVQCCTNTSLGHVLVVVPCPLPAADGGVAWSSPGAGAAAVTRHGGAAAIAHDDHCGSSYAGSGDGTVTRAQLHVLVRHSRDDDVDDGETLPSVVVVGTSLRHRAFVSVLC